MNSRIEGKSLLILGLAGSGKTRLAKTLCEKKSNVYIINDQFKQWDYPELEISDLNRKTSEMTIVIEDIDALIDKRNWMAASQKDMIGRITQKITESRHVKVTLIGLGRASEVPGPIFSITNAKVYCNNDSRRITYYYVEYPTCFSCTVKIMDPLLADASIL